MGLRIEHPQTLINQYQYGCKEHDTLGAAAYKLAHKAASGRGIYSFCMCPGGYVVNASSEKNMLAVNGMSYQDRASKNANSAMIVTVTPDDYGNKGPLSGVEFQRELERTAYGLGGGKIPLQLFGDFKENRRSTGLGLVTPCLKGDWSFANLRELFPSYISSALQEGITYFDRMIQDFQGMTQCSQVWRAAPPPRCGSFGTEGLESSLRGLYPCGEGAGYAGGIMSAAMDGMKVLKLSPENTVPSTKTRMIKKFLME